MKQIFSQLIANGVVNWTLASHFFLTFHVNRSIYLLLNFNLNDILRKMSEKQRRRKRERDREQQRARMRNATEEQRQAEQKQKRERRRNSKLTAERERQREVRRTVPKNNARGKLRDADREL